MPSNLTHPGADGPAVTFAPVTPSDGADLPGGAARAIFVGGAGDVVLRGPDGVEATFSSGAGQYHPVRAVRVLATGTTATGIVALF
ncbi:spike base protein, RCAP_Rcc01079 family [Rhodovulum sp. DZ06]|uniref:spike base protein, RCAP_Rcc01079 family n=1 Tax=Rhodovulum sp. DZ06 TaxID=3425126 RepID=UPI003D326E69